MGKPQASRHSLKSAIGRLLLATLLMSSVAVSEIPPECPTASCECRKVEGRWMVDCQGRGFESMPHFLRSYITWWQVDLSKNIIQDLNSGDFQPFRTLLVNLSANGMRSVRRTALSGLGESMELLDLSDNDFHDVNAIESGAFDTLTNLKVIHLQNNVVKDLPAAPSLEYLNLDANTMKEFPVFVHKYKALRTLSLRANVIKEIPSETFDNLPELLSLDLTLNSIRSVNACVILPHPIRELFLDYNPVECDCHLAWLKAAGMKLSTNETGLGFLCPGVKFNCGDGYSFCNLSPTSIPPRGSATHSRPSFKGTLFILGVITLTAKLTRICTS